MRGREIYAFHIADFASLVILLVPNSMEQDGLPAWNEPPGNHSFARVPPSLGRILFSRVEVPIVHLI